MATFNVKAMCAFFQNVPVSVMLLMILLGFVIRVVIALTPLNIWVPAGVLARRIYTQIYVSCSFSNAPRMAKLPPLRTW